MPRKKREPSFDMADRLDAVRKAAGLSLAEFHRRLIEDGTYDVSYQSVQNYHADRESPVGYLARVAEVFRDLPGSDFTYLATGRRTPSDDPPTRAREAGESDDVEWIERVEMLIALRHEMLWSTSFFGPLGRASGVRDVLSVIDDLLSRAGHKRLGRHPPGERPTLADIDRSAEQFEESLFLLDATVAEAWEGMRRVIAHAFGSESVERLTLDQQMRFADQMILALWTLTPDHGAPAAFREKTDG